MRTLFGAAFARPIAVLAIPCALFIGSQANAGILFDPINADSSVSNTVVPACLFGFCSTTTLTTTLSDLDSQNVMLEVGDSHEFDFFNAMAGGTGAASFDIAATLAFGAPGGSVSNNGSGGFFSILGTVSGGILSWDNASSIVDLGNGTIFEVAFEDGIAIGFGNSTNIGATVTLIEASVPEPGTLALMLAGLAGVVTARRHS